MKESVPISLKLELYCTSHIYVPRSLFIFIFGKLYIGSCDDKTANEFFLDINEHNIFSDTTYFNTISLFCIKIDFSKHLHNNPMTE